MTLNHEESVLDQASKECKGRYINRNVLLLLFFLNMIYPAHSTLRIRSLIYAEVAEEAPPADSNRPRFLHYLDATERS